MGDIALYVALTLVLMWTVRMARSKGKNPWLWGGLAFILMVIPSLKLLSVIPIIFLMFMKGSPEPRRVYQPGERLPQMPGAISPELPVLHQLRLGPGRTVLS